MEVMNSKIFIIDTYYRGFIDSFYSKNTWLKNASYKEQKARIMDQMFGNSDFMSFALQGLGCVAVEEIVNNYYLQKSWEKEHLSSKLDLKSEIGNRLIRMMPFIDNRVASNWEYKILAEQIKRFKPDIIYNKNISYINPIFLKTIKKECKLLVGQIASPLPPDIYLKPYDLIITSLPNFVKKLRRKGINSEYLKLAFDPRVLTRITKQNRKYDVTFVGGISRAHKKGISTLSELANKIRLDVWGYGKENIATKSNLYKYHHGEAWGKEMYILLMQSKITINRHIDVSENYANNLRLYEATGCGAMLLTDYKKNLGEIFEIDKEVVTYKSLDELERKIKYYIRHEKARKKIAEAGQKRTLKEHNYKLRMKELADILNKYI